MPFLNVYMHYLLHTENILNRKQSVLLDIFSWFFEPLQPSLRFPNFEAKWDINMNLVNFLKFSYIFLLNQEFVSTYLERLPSEDIHPSKMVVLLPLKLT